MVPAGVPHAGAAALRSLEAGRRASPQGGLLTWPVLAAGRPPRPRPRPREGLHGVVWLLASPPERVIEGKVCRGPCD